MTGTERRSGRSLPALARAGAAMVRRGLCGFDWGLKRPERRRSFLVNFGIGLIVGAAFYFLSHLPFMENLLNTTVDKMIYWESYGFLKRSAACRTVEEGASDCAALRARMSDAIVFVDFDDDTLVEWGDPFFIPRDRLASIVRIADREGARILLFDILFDVSSGVPGADAALRRALEEAGRRGRLKVVLPVLKAKRDGRARRNIFDDVIDAHPNLYRAVPYVSASPSDKAVRYLRYYETVKGPKGEDRVLWGTHALGAFLFLGEGGRLEALEAGILDDAAKGRQGRYVLQGGDGRFVVVGNSEFFSNRIRFGLIPPAVFGGEGNLFTERMLPDEVEALGRGLKDKIVIVGTSSADREPWYATSVGDMPGMYVIGNGVNMLVGGWQVRDAPLWLKVATWLFIIAFAAYMFANLKAPTARLVSAGALFAVLFPLTCYFFWKQNIMINAALLFVNALLPLMAMGWEKVPGAAAKVFRTGSGAGRTEGCGGS